MATTESSAVIRLINSVQAQPIFDSFHEPMSKPVAQPVEAPPMQAKPMTAPPMPAKPMALPPMPELSFEADPAHVPALSRGTGTVVVGHPRKRRRWPLFALAAVGLLAVAGGVGYAVGTSGSGPKTPGAAAGVAPALAQDETQTEAAAAVAEATPAQAAVAATPAAEAAVAETPHAEPVGAGAPIVTDVVPEDTFDAGFDIIVEPSGARVVLDGKELGPAPLRIGRLAAGAHVVDVTAPEGYESQRVELDLVSGERKVVRVALDRVQGEQVVAEELEAEPAVRKASKRTARRSKRAEKRVATSKSAKKPAAAKGGKGTLMLGAKPPCKIFIDGKNTGLLTPQRSIELSAGKHKVTLVNAEHNLKVSTTVTIEPGKTKRLIKDMSSRL